MTDPYHGLSLEDWHHRYSQQARWTSNIRQHLLARAGTNSKDKILEIGSGTGAILEQLAKEGHPRLTGIDIDRKALSFTKQKSHNFILVQADGRQLPFLSETFDISLCHYLLLWVQKPEQILSEMRRVTRSGGCLIALAEPDHLARIDYPPPLEKLGRLQTQALQKQGADIAIGRKIQALFTKTGLKKVETGILGGQWTAGDLKRTDETEWMALRADLSQELSEETLSHYKKVDQKARNAGQRVLFIPTFYAFGVVP